MYWVEIFVVVLICSVIGAAIFTTGYGSEDPHIVLQKSEWECSKMESRINIDTPHNSDTCVEYRRVK